MGFALTWLAARGIERDEFHRRLGLRSTGLREEEPESDYTAVTQDGWHVVISNVFDHRFVGGGSLRRVSAGAEVVGAAVEEHSMASMAAAYRDRRSLWRVTFTGAGTPAAVGDPPEFAEILLDFEARAHANQRVAFMFEVPLEVANRVTGFRHDTQPDTEERERFEVLELRPLSGGWFAGLRRRFTLRYWLQKFEGE